MLSKAKIKYIHSLEQKKIRRQENAFVAEGHKSVGDLLQAGCTARLIIATEEWRSPVALGSETERITVTAEELLSKGILSKCEYGYKVLGNGNVTKKVTVQASAFSASAKEAIEAAGGKAEVK